jgi:hypothetical protein
MNLAIMQPYFLPYIGYFQLIAAVDRFVVYDNIQYSKRGWVNRNRMLQDGRDVTFTLPLQRDSDYLEIRSRTIAPDFVSAKLLNQLAGNYRKAPHFEEVMPLLETMLRYEDTNLFRYLHNSLTGMCDHLGITTEIVTSSQIEIDDELAGQDRVLALCTAESATRYVNAIGGVELYSPDAFAERGVELRFLRSTAGEYRQFGSPFVPWLSIIDILMFTPLEKVQQQVENEYELV